MNRSKHNGTTTPPGNQKGGHYRRERLDDEEDYDFRKVKKSGKRFHRKRSFREKYWDDMPDND
jgi:hypothetical protein